MSSYRQEREAAAHWKEMFDTVNRQRTDMGLTAIHRADSSSRRATVFNALVTALQQARMAVPDLLVDLDVDATAAAICDQLGL